MASLSELIDERLWKEVKKNYLNEEYSNSVLDAIQFLGDRIREMSGEDGDGYDLMGRVFNDKSPKIKVNRLRTQTEKNIQNGTMLLLQGFYRAIRNERVHEKKDDSEQEAYELILFLNHILRIVDKSKGKFSVDNTLRRVFDDNFLPRKNYVKHIIDDVPPSKRYEVAIEVLRNRGKSKRNYDLSIFWTHLIEELTTKELEELRADISESLRYTDDVDEATSTIFLIGGEWKRLEVDSRLRVENMLIRNLPSYLSNDPLNGPSETDYKDTINAINYLYKNEVFDLKKELYERLLLLLEKRYSNIDEYIISNFGLILRELDSELKDGKFEAVLIKKLKAGGNTLVPLIEKLYPKEQVVKLKGYLPVKESTDMEDDLPF